MNDWTEQEAWRQAHREQIATTLRLMWLFWLGSLAEPVVLAIMAYGFVAPLREGFTPDETIPLALLRAIFIAAAILTLGASCVLRALLLRPPSGNRASSAATSAGSLPGGALYRSRAVIPTVMAATPSILGFVLFWLGDSLMVFTGFAVAALLGMLWQYPRQDGLIGFCMRCENADTSEGR